MIGNTLSKPRNTALRDQLRKALEVEQLEIAKKLLEKALAWVEEPTSGKSEWISQAREFLERNG